MAILSGLSAVAELDWNQEKDMIRLLPDSDYFPNIMIVMIGKNTQLKQGYQVIRNPHNLRHAST